MRFQVAIIGTSQSGKSTVAKTLDEMCGGGYFDTSDMLKEGFAQQLLMDGKVPGYKNYQPLQLGSRAKDRAAAMDEVMRCKTDKPEYRKGLMDYGIEQEKRDPLFTILEPLQRACFVSGTRTEAQIVEMRKRVDWVVWVWRNYYEPNETDRVTRDDADFTIENNGTLVALRNRLEAWLLLFGPGTAELQRRREKYERIEVESLPG